jgi:hypothetical protein
VAVGATDIGGATGFAGGAGDLTARATFKAGATGGWGAAASAAG